MARGHPDYGLSAPTFYIFPIVSWEDWFMRQGLIKTLDGKGDIIFFDSFEGGPSKWYQVSGDADNYIELSPDHARGGNWALKFNVANAGTKSCEAAATIPITTPGKYGVEENFVFYADYYFWYVKLWYYAINKLYAFELRFSPTLKKLAVFGPGGGWTTFATLTDWPNEPNYYFNPVKLVVDLATLKYVKAIVLGVTYDLSAYSPAVDTLTCSRAIQARFKYSFQSGAIYPAYIDDVIVTMNEE